ncbi:MULTISPECIES: AlwI family type II restriction endonuclease [Bacillus cereus group]|uniref:AlwI family type II restriction endonuclease n=1 Tax=Bacillus cereus group TaxID=86661 RepID=UPI0022E4CDF6|nr:MULTISPECIES: AlwI family type II restriction endonuclease [unclassified Bacillus cereus group]MDA2662443.1 AlwI family type II restriction endonuclease [Bacillus cereus group sp. Bc032]MDA2673178.1 AlwI family type II restriction endonuclease [Bacillus cereus group sp. Bc031]MDA2678606.1 AlwI family type II restriction endonuclease [Bacillus cereus group sp. Bc029]MDA2684115.1 AlwI family type II restriction endonuclease [Bacillus cereus group sp. Bc030]MDA2739579.1 AlwI family type II res
MPWLIADNGVRNPHRLKYGLQALVNSEFHGNFNKINEEGMTRLLEEQGIISLQTNSDNTIARKWRVNLIRLGFISKDTHTVTNNGRSLIHSESLPEQEDCFLRALLMHQLPSVLHPMKEGDINNPFNPLRLILEVLNLLSKRGEQETISKNEMASILMLHYSMDDVSNIVDEIINYRKQREKSVGNLRKFDKLYRENAAKKDGGRVSADSLIAYADVNIRYLRLSGLFAEEGVSRLSIAVHKHTIVQQILSTPYYSVLNDDAYKKALGNGAMLPTDNESEAIVAIRDLNLLLNKNGELVENLPVNLHDLDAKELTRIRIRLENQWIHLLEKQFALEQKNQWQEIIQYMKALQQPTRIGKRDSIIPSGEGPAYLEWTIWRAFLAINSLHNKPWEARRFIIDRNFLPVRHASGGDADMIFEFEEFVVVVEVTLTTSSRQEAAEGEPVRRHVAKHVDYYSKMGKRVYGLFIANSVDTNTAETFRIGVWYRSDDSQMAVQIVPITLRNFTDIFESLFQRKPDENHSNYLRQLMNDLLSFSNYSAPQWKKQMEEDINRKLIQLNA